MTLRGQDTRYQGLGGRLPSSSSPIPAAVCPRSGCMLIVPVLMADRGNDEIDLKAIATRARADLDAASDEAALANLIALAL